MKTVISNPRPITIVFFTNIFSISDWLSDKFTICRDRLAKALKRPVKFSVFNSCDKASTANLIKSCQDNEIDALISTSWQPGDSFSAPVSQMEQTLKEAKESSKNKKMKIFVIGKNYTLTPMNPSKINATEIASFADQIIINDLTTILI